MTTIIKGENGCHLVLSNILLIGDVFSAMIEIQSDWYHAKLSFESSYQRFNDFVISLEKIISFQLSETKFINEYGNIDLTISVNLLGKVTVSGCLLKDMLSQPSLIYEFESDVQSLSKFYSQLNILLN